MLELRAHINQPYTPHKGFDEELRLFIKDLRRQHYDTVTIHRCWVDRYHLRCVFSFKKTVIVDLKEVKVLIQKLNKWFERFHPMFLDTKLGMIDHTYYKDYEQRAERLAEEAVKRRNYQREYKQRNGHIGDTADGLDTCNAIGA